MRGLNRHKIAVIGLGYVGLPLAVEFGMKYRTIGLKRHVLYDVKYLFATDQTDGRL